MAFIRLGAALLGWFFGFFLGATLLEVTVVTPVTNQILVVFLLATACAILGWLGAPYVTVLPARIIKRRIQAASAGDLVGMAFGGGVGLILALFLAFPLSFLPDNVGRFAPTSVIIDGRVADVVKSGFIRGTLVVPRFILAELQFFADSPDASKRERGRRGLEMLSRMQKEATVQIELLDADPVANGADGKLIALARQMGVPIMTNDYGLNRVAELQGVTVLNVNDLAKAVRPVVLPSEELTVRITQEGKEPGQGLGYLEDGTMVVVENGARHINTELTVTVMRVLQTVGGRMIFAQPKGEIVEVRRPRAASH